ncbi:MAG: NUDIX domain-containing protein [Clostridiales bacterium]|nr:NUDIX domain-containing protein [Clostridiales bacterium]
MKGGFALAAKAVIIKNDKALILRRSEKEMKGSYLNKYEPWDLPGGSIRFHENCTEGLLREIGEETSFKVKIIKPIRIFDVVKNQVHMTIVTYMCLYRSGGVYLSEEHDKYYWLTLKEAEDMRLPKWIIKDIKLAMNELK